MGLYIGKNRIINLHTKHREVETPKEREISTPYDVEEEEKMNFQMVEVVKNINRFESSIKHKPNVFSVVVDNSNLAPDNSDSRDEVLEDYKEKLRESVTQFVRNTCESIVPVHTQLFDVQFT